MQTLDERFWSKVDQNGPVPAHRPDLGPCWLWTAEYLMPNGYGQLGVGGAAGGMQYAHRVAYELLVGPIPDGLEIDHLCFVRHCVNPDHLEPVTHAENVRRQKARITHCPQGHAYDAANTHIGKKGERKCRACGRERWHRRVKDQPRSPSTR